MASYQADNGHPVKCRPPRGVGDVIDEILDGGKPATVEQWCYVESYLRWALTKFYHNYTSDDSVVLDRAVILMNAARWYRLQGEKAYMAVQWYNWNSHLIETVFIARKMAIAVGGSGYDDGDTHIKSINAITFQSPVEEVATFKSVLIRMGRVFRVYFKSHPKNDMEWLQGWYDTDPEFTGQVAQATFLRDVKLFQNLLEGVREYEHNDRQE